MAVATATATPTCSLWGWARGGGRVTRRWAGRGGPSQPGSRPRLSGSRIGKRDHRWRNLGCFGLADGGTAVTSVTSKTDRPRHLLPCSPAIRRVLQNGATAIGGYRTATPSAGRTCSIQINTGEVLHVWANPPREE